MNIAEEMVEPVALGNAPAVAECAKPEAPDRPISIYQVHLPSWRRVPEEQNRPLKLQEIAPKLAEYAHFMHFTHVQIHSIQYTDPSELGFLIDQLHQRGLGVILDSDRAVKDTGPLKKEDLSADGLCVYGTVHLFDRVYQRNENWAEETAAYFGTDPFYRKFRHARFVRPDIFAFNTDHILPLSDRLVTPSHSSLLMTMPGDLWQKFANLRLLFAYTFLLPGKKLVFMGDEFGQPNPWQRETSLDWHVINESNLHGKLMNWVANLNRFYRGERALHETDCMATGFQWLDTSDADSSIISFLRWDANNREVMLVALNFTPVTRHNYRIGVPEGGFWKEILNSDAQEFGGSGQGNLGGVETAPFGWNLKPHSLMLTLPPLGATVLKASWVGDHHH